MVSSPDWILFNKSHNNTTNLGILYITEYISSTTEMVLTRADSTTGSSQFTQFSTQYIGRFSGGEKIRVVAVATYNLATDQGSSLTASYFTIYGWMD